MATRLAPARPTRAPRPDAAPAPAERRHLRVVPPGYVSVRTRQKRARLIVVLGGVALAAALFAVVAFHVVLTQNQLNLQHLQSEADAASVKQQQLRLQVAQLESPERVVDAAQKLGMVPPATVHYLSPNGTPGVSKPAPVPAPTSKVTTVPARAAAAKTSTAKPTATTTPAAKPATTKAAPTKTSTPSRAPTTTTPLRRTR
jgi:cell division protein FtsL